MICSFINKHTNITSIMKTIKYNWKFMNYMITVPFSEMENRGRKVVYTNFCRQMERLLCLTIISILFFACGSDSDDTPEPIIPKIDLEVENITLPETIEGKTTVAFTSSVDWSVKLTDTRATPDWLEVNPKNGKAGSATITLSTTKKNENLDERQAYVHINAGTVSKVVTVIQKRKEDLNLTPEECYVPASKGNINIDLTTNLEYKVSISDDCKEWVTLAKSKKGENFITHLEFAVTENTSVVPRTGTVTFSANNISKTLTINQEAGEPTISLNTTTKEVSATTGNFTLELTSNSNWFVNGIPSWITLSKTSGNGNASITINYQTNTSISPRSATITFIADNVTRTLTINQAGATPFISLSFNSKTVVSSSGYFTIALTSNTAWTASGMPSWITVTRASGVGNANIRINHQKNTLSTSRKAVISFTAGNVTQTLTIVQNNSQLDDFEKEEL